MSVELRLLDHLKLTHRLCVNFACSYSEDDRLFVLSESGVFIIALKGYLTYAFPQFSCKIHFLKLSDFLPCENIDLDINSFHKDLQREDHFETAMSLEYSGNLMYSSRADVFAVAAQWSPRGIVGKTDCLLGILANTFSLELYVKHIDENEVLEYFLACNLTKEIIDQQKPQWKSANRFATNLKLKEMKRRIEIITPTAFVWSHLFYIGNVEQCVIFAGHMNGDITAWRISLIPLNSHEQLKPQFLGRYSTQLSKITTLHWHRTREFAGGLSFADAEGKMSVLNITQLDQEVALMDKELAFWTEPDNVLVDSITVMVYENRTYIIMTKQSFLIIYGIVETGEVFDQKVYQVENYYITGIQHFNNIIIVLTLPGVLKQFTLFLVKDRILLEEKIIPLKIDMSTYRTHGFFFSKNRVLFGVLACPCKLRVYSKLKTFSNIFLFHNNLLNPFEILWYNKSNSLRDYWDCFETLRLLCLKDKRFPWLGLSPDLNYDNLSLLRLKTLRWLAKLSEQVFNSVPVIKSYNIKTYIILHYLVEIKLIVRRINDLLNLRNSGTELSLFQMRSIDVQNFFLKEMVLKDILTKANVGRNFVSEMAQVMRIANELKYPPMCQCVWCGEKIIGPLCIPPHADSRCSISMMPIFFVASYKCPFCKVLAHKELEKEQVVIFCPYCDIPMEKRFIQESFNNKDYAVICEEVKSACFDDCLKEDIDFSDVEENTSEFVIFSDSDEESVEEQDKLRTLYLRMRDMSLGDIVKHDSEVEVVSEIDIAVAGPSRKVMKLEQEDIECL